VSNCSTTTKTYFISASCQGNISNLC